MLPTPVTLYEKRGFPGRSQRKTRDVLLSRARVTNLGLLLLVSFSTLSVLFNLGYYFSSAPDDQRGRPPIPPHSILATIERDRTLLVLDHLVIVPGHGVWKGTQADDALDEEDWVLESYQKGGGRVAAFYNHIRQG